MFTLCLFLKAGFYNQWFLQQDGLIDPFERSTYHSHKLRNDSVLFVLDTEVVSSANEQAQWLRNEISSKYFNYPWKMSLFHNPMYPTVTSYGTGISKDIREVVNKKWRENKIKGVGTSV